MPAASDDAASSGGLGVRKPPREETAIWARWPGRVGRHPQLWGFELWTDRSNGQGARGLS
jgi:hypothetical protein